VGKKRLNARRQLHGWDAFATGLAFRWHRRRASPFDPARGRAMIVHVDHHKAATVWMQRVLQDVARAFFLDLVAPYGYRDSSIPASVDIVRRHAQHYAPGHFPAGFRGSHVIRDPRDIVVSGYFYHLWTDEPWARAPDPRYGGRSYQEHLNSLSPGDGLLAEIEYRRRASDAPALTDIGAWDYSDPRFLELRYEDMMADPEGQFRRLFTHYGFHPAAVERGIEFGLKHSFQRRTGRNVGEVEERSHFRSGESGQWRKHFDDRHRRAFKECHGDLVVRLGYEPDNDW
jgi:hypothetical protein